MPAFYLQVFQPQVYSTKAPFLNIAGRPYPVKALEKWVNKRRYCCTAEQYEQTQQQ